MLSYIMNTVQGLGSTGLFIAMFLEGCSLPFPGIIVILTFGYLLHPSIQEIFWLSMGMGIAYSVASYIPYAIGRRIDTNMETNGEGKQLSAKLTKAIRWFHHHGEWSVCVTRPFILGNYISYAAGMSRVKPWRYGLLTFIGIFPWAFLMLLLGKMYHVTVGEYGSYFLTPVIFFLLFGGTAFLFVRRTNLKE